MEPQVLDWCSKWVLHIKSSKTTCLMKCMHFYLFSVFDLVLVLQKTSLLLGHFVHTSVCSADTASTLRRKHKNHSQHVTSWPTSIHVLCVQLCSQCISDTLCGHLVLFLEATDAKHFSWRTLTKGRIWQHLTHQLNRARLLISSATYTCMLVNMSFDGQNTVTVSVIVTVTT